MNLPIVDCFRSTKLTLSCGSTYYVSVCLFYCICLCMSVGRRVKSLAGWGWGRKFPVGSFFFFFFNGCLSPMRPNWEFWPNFSSRQLPLTAAGDISQLSRKLIPSDPPLCAATPSRCANWLRSLTLFWGWNRTLDLDPAPALGHRGDWRASQSVLLSGHRLGNIYPMVGPDGGPAPLHHLLALPLLTNLTKSLWL